MQQDHLRQYWADVKAGKRSRPERTRSQTVRRKMRCDHNWLKNGEVIVTMQPGYFTFQEPRHRAKYKLSLKEAFRQAVMITTNRITARAKELRKEGMRRGALAQARKEILA